MEYLLVDFENISPAKFPEVGPDQTILIFAGEKQTKVNMELVLSTQPLGNRVEWKVISGSGKNAVDFHIAFYIGKYSISHPGSIFKILSRDKGFDPLLKHMKGLGINCVRLECFPLEKLAKIVSKEKDADLSSHFEKMDEKSRPKKVSKLKAYIKNKIRKEDPEVELFFNRLISDKVIEVKDEKVTYMFPNQIEIINGDEEV